MDKEVLATSAVKDSISWTDRLKPYIPEKDKEPIWDGSVYVYSTASTSNDTSLMGRVPTQIKGTEVKTFQELESFDVPLSSLRQFLAEGGAVFFVVELSKGTEEKRIFYNSLLPYDIILYLESCKKSQKTKSITLRPFPRDNNEKVDIFVNFLQNREKQKTISGLGRIVPVEELITTTDAFNITISYFASKAYGLPEYALGHELYTYFTNAGGVTFPIDHITNISEVGTTAEGTLICDQKHYCMNMTRILRKDGCEYSFGKAFHFFVKEQQSEGKFVFCPSGNLDERIRDYELMLTLMKEGRFILKSIDFSLCMNVDNTDEERCARIETGLTDLREIKSALEYMGAVIPLDLDTLSETDLRKINNLLIPASKGIPVSIDGMTEPRQAGVLSIGNLNLMVLGVRQDDGTYLLSNFFAEPLYRIIRAVDDSLVPCCYYVILKKEELIALSNIDLSIMLERITADEPHPLYVNEINLLLLKLLGAYDDTKRDDFLSTAIMLSEWLCNLDRDDAIGKINYLQAVKRKRPLEECEKKSLLQIAYNPTSSNTCKMGANILLEDFPSAKLQYQAMEQEERSQYDDYPIMTLWRR